MEKCRKAENKKKQMINGYIGTYFSESSKGVYRFAFYPESGELAEPELFYEAKDAKWVSCSEGRLCFPMEEEGKAGTFRQTEAPAIFAAAGRRIAACRSGGNIL